MYQLQIKREKYYGDDNWHDIEPPNRRYMPVRAAWSDYVLLAKRGPCEVRVRIWHDSGRIYDEWVSEYSSNGWRAGYVVRIPGCDPNVYAVSADGVYTEVRDGHNLLDHSEVSNE